MDEEKKEDRKEKLFKDHGLRCSASFKHVRVFRNLVYMPIQHPQLDPVKHLLDIYVPWDDDHENRVKHRHDLYPVVMYIPGGAWLWGDKSEFKPRDIGKQMARRGFVTCVISYRLSRFSRNDVGEIGALLSFILLMIMVSRQDFEKRVWLLVGILTILLFLYAELQLNTIPNHHPAHVRDCSHALKWIHDEIDQYRGDVNNIFVMGHSAGGHLATLLASHPDYLSECGLNKSSIKAVVGISGVYCDKRLEESALGCKIGKNVFGGDHKNWPEAFPINHIYDDQPPVLLINSEYEYGLKIHAYDYYKALKHAGIQVEQVSFKTLNHFSIISFWGDEHKQVAKKVCDYLRRKMI